MKVETQKQNMKQNKTEDKSNIFNNPNHLPDKLTQLQG